MTFRATAPTKIPAGMFALLACTDPNDLDVFPRTLDLGEVEFAPEMPEEGYYAAGPIDLVNDGQSTLSLMLPEYDTTSLCIQGFLTQEFPVTMTELEPGQTFTLTVGICGYPPGNDGLETIAPFDVWLDSDAAPVELAAAFVPRQVTE